MELNSHQHKAQRRLISTIVNDHQRCYQDGNDDFEFFQDDFEFFQDETVQRKKITSRKSSENDYSVYIVAVTISLSLFQKRF